MLALMFPGKLLSLVYLISWLLTGSSPKKKLVPRHLNIRYLEKILWKLPVSDLIILSQ